MNKRHSLLERQLRRSVGKDAPVSEPYDQLLALVDEAYHQSDRDREMLERALDLSSHELLQANSQMRAVFQAFPDLFFEIDSDGVILAHMGGSATDFYAAAGKLVGRRLQEVPSTDLSRRFRDAIDRSLRSGGLVAIEYAVELHGRSQHYEARFLPQRSGQLFVVVRNITVLKEVEHELRHAKEAAEAADDAKSQFLATMSHELRTPLNSVIGFANILIKRTVDRLRERELDFLGKIVSNGKHLLNLIDDLLDLSKIEAGKLEIQVESVDVRAIVAELVASIQPEVERNANRLTVSIADDIENLRTDPTRLRQILVNLLANACKFTRDGEIAIAVRRCQHEGTAVIEFTVTDTGIGMTAEQLARLFQPFTQADASTARMYGGTGLGLTISRRFTTLLGGHIAVWSEPERGSTFTVGLPAGGVPPAAAAGPPDSAAAPS